MDHRLTRRSLLIDASLAGALASLGAKAALAEEETPATKETAAREVPAGRDHSNSRRHKLLIRRASVLKLDAGGNILKDADIAIEGSRIVAVGEAPRGFKPDRTIDAYNRLAMAGMWNTHTHASMTMLRGFAEDLPPDRWFLERVRPVEAVLTDDDVYWGAALAACEMIRGGCVGFNDHYFFMDRVAEVVDQSGMKATLAWAIFGIPPAEIGGTTLERTLQFIQRWQGAADGRIRTVLGPHSPYLSPEPFLREVADVSRERQIPVHIHVAETAQQVADSLAQHGLTPVAYLDSLGIFDVPGGLSAHSIHVNAADIAILANRRISVSHCPISFMKLGLGVNDLRPTLNGGVNLALGTDGAASNNDMDMKDVIRFTTLLQKYETGDATTLAGDLPLRLATANGAKAMGFTNSGVLAPGRDADIVLFDIDQAHLYPRHNLVANLVHSAEFGDVTHLIVDGRVIYRDREIQTLDEEKVRAEAESRAKRLVRRAGF